MTTSVEDADDPGFSDVADAAALDASAPNLPALDGPCTPGASRCAGVELDTCAPVGDGWVRTTCFPGTFCTEGACRPIAMNLILVFDTSGSMSTTVPNKLCTGNKGFPSCVPAQGCTRMDVSKVVFQQALAQIDPSRVAMSLFHFPTRIDRVEALTCEEGYQTGLLAMTADSNVQRVTDKTAWYWAFLQEVMAVPLPAEPSRGQRDRERDGALDGRYRVDCHHRELLGWTAGRLYLVDGMPRRSLLRRNLP